MSEAKTTKLTREEWDEIRAEAVDFAGIGLYRYLFDGTVLFMDRGAMNILGLLPDFSNPEEISGRNIADLVDYVGPRGYLRNAIREHGHVRYLEYPFRTLTGELRWALHSSYLVRDARTGQEAIQAIIRDITPRKTAEIDLQAERERLAVTLRSIGDGVITTDMEGRITLLNKVAEELTGWHLAEAMGRPLAEVFRIINETTRMPCENPVDRVLQTGGVIGLANHTALVARDGRERIIADSGAPIRDVSSRIVGVVLVFRDITDRRRQEMETQRIEKLESVGVLAGGIAHDFNNLLSGVIGNLSLARLYVGPGRPVSDLIEQAEKAALRARDLTQQLLTFARGGAPVKQKASMEAIVRESAAFALSGSRSRCAFEFAPDVWSVDVDTGQISQVIQNLVINADQAMPRGGTVRIDVRNARIDNMERPGLVPGPYVRVDVSDTGMGIPDDEQGRVFDPYFTTKRAGSGLGLTICHSIVRGHDGYIGFESQVGTGSTFTVFLPAIMTHAEVEEAPSLEPLRGSGRILVLDDEQIVRDVIRLMLSHLGYQVEFVTDGKQAVACYQESLSSDHPFDAVILDLTIPGGMGGAEAIRLLRLLDPNVRAIASSGYSSDPVMANHRSFGFCDALPKPFSIADFSRVLLKVLG